MKKIFLNTCLIAMSLFSVVHAADEEEDVAPKQLYFAFEPELVTNYISSRGSMGYVRASIELMVENPSDLSLLEFHEPLLRATLIEILGSQSTEKVKSLDGREEIRQECRNKLNKVIKQETGESPITNLLLTRYLYD